MTCLLQIVALLLFAYHASAQIRECPPMSLEVLQSTDNSRRSTLLVQTYNTNVNPTDPFIVVEEINIVCEAAASKRDTYRYASVVVRQICSGFVCPEATRDISTVVQYDFECSIINQWIPEALGSTSIRDDDPEADLDTEPAERCAVCAILAAGADSVTHCRVCQSGCTEGLMLCTTLGSGCCTYYSNDMCVSECPNDSVADCDFNCVEPQECPLLEIENGTVTIESTDDDCNYWRRATYECDEDLELDGVEVRDCQLDGEWTEDAPSCLSTPTTTPTPATTPTPTTDDGSSGITDTELGIVIAVVVLFFLIVAGVFLGFVAVWACRN